MNNHQIKLTFNKIQQELTTIRALIRQMPQVQIQLNPRLQPTLTALKALGGSATATQVCKVTGKSRANESQKLNHLNETGQLTKAYRGKKVLFTLKETKQT